MTLQVIQLRKLIRILYSAPNKRLSLLRADIRDDISKESGDGSGGADFYGPFWYDAKNHALGVADLHESTKSRIEGNSARANLYPQLRDGFLIWWNERRRWTNEPFEPALAPKGRYRFANFNAVVKVDNFLSVKDAFEESHYVYPYFSPDPVIDTEAARLSLWLIGRALPDLNWDEIRLLDVIRGKTFDVDRTPLLGTEETVFLKRYGQAIEQWNLLRSEY